MALGIEIDVLRTWIGQWATEESSKGVAREIAYAMAAAHLARDRDVVLPPLDIRPEVIERLEAMAENAGARFVEVILTAPPAELTTRLTRPRTGQAPHPRDLFSSEDLAAHIEHYANELERLRQSWPRAVAVDIAGLTPSEAVARVTAAIDW